MEKLLAKSFAKLTASLEAANGDWQGFEDIVFNACESLSLLRIYLKQKSVDEIADATSSARLLLELGELRLALSVFSMQGEEMNISNAVDAKFIENFHERVSQFREQVDM